MSQIPDHHGGMGEETLRYLDSLGFFGWQLGLERVQRLCSFYGDPQKRFPAIHLAGTNGKGSTAAMLAAIAKAAGLRVGLYTSPHLVQVNERIQINGEPISGQELEEEIRSCRALVDALGATYFELLTAIAFAVFAKQRVDLAIIETGLGGRLDATNVIIPEVTIITSIGLEHQQYLGRTLTAITTEKAGIIKSGVPCVSGAKQKRVREVLAQACDTLQAPFIDATTTSKINPIKCSEAGTIFDLKAPAYGIYRSQLCLNLLGQHQAENARLAVIACALLSERGFPVHESAVRSGLQNTHWPARMQLIPGSPRVLIDAAHNAEGMRVLAQNVQQIFPSHRVKVVLALLQDKGAAKAVQAWRELEVEFFFTAASSERSRSAEELLAVAQKLGYSGQALASPTEAFTRARQSCAGNDLLCLTGSHYVIGDLIAAGLVPYPYGD